ncbi:MAG: helix-turn-helix domain-containing protein [Woeseiaceae bacterium]|nr:helix-turn-helix domain-containing protein [Woeseiaceae bacterium]
MRETYRVSDLDQLRLLADPLKLKLIQAFAEQPRTTREVADELGENLTRLYRHVDALLAAGLIEITREEKKRGTVERTFAAVARRFEVDRALLSETDDHVDAVRELLRAGEDELIAALDRHDADSEPLFMRLRIKGSPARLRELQASLEAWLESAQELKPDDEDNAAAEAGAIIAFYPVRRE